MNELLLTPGPVDLPDFSRFASAEQMISHRCDAFSHMYGELIGRLGDFFKVTSPVIPFPSSGTGALDALCQNLLKPHDTVISVSCGAFGNRFRRIAGAAGAGVVCVDVPLGEAVQPDVVLGALEKYPRARAILITHNETSTAVTNDLARICADLPKERPLVLADCVSSAGAMECYPQTWGLDGIATSSQKGLMSPPGVGLVWFSDRAWSVCEQIECRCESMDMKMFRKSMKSLQTPYTPPVSIYRSLISSLGYIEAYGADKWFGDHRRFAASLCLGCAEMGLELLVKDKSVRSCGVTAVMDSGELCSALSLMGVRAAGGQDELKGKIARFAHYTDCAVPRLMAVLGSVWAALRSLGRAPGSGWHEAAMTEWEKF